MSRMDFGDHRLSAIFVSYRRRDTGSVAPRIYDTLTSYFGRQAVFMDIDSIRPGEAFTVRINDALMQCAVLIALIGKRWAWIVDNHGNRRLHDADDHVRRELVLAFER